MSDEHIPAWKRAGLKKEKPKASDGAYDPLEAGLKRNAETAAADNKPKKPAKRAKLPKDERKPGPEADQLAYLRQFSEDRENWKFSKQKQNWILRNIYTIDDKYNEPLIAYVASVQGGSKDRIVEEANKRIEDWNTFMREKPAEPEESTKNESEKADKPEETETSSESAKKPVKKGILKNAKAANPEPKRDVPTETSARRAQTIVEKLTGTKPELEFVD